MDMSPSQYRAFKAKHAQLKKDYEPAKSKALKAKTGGKRAFELAEAAGLKGRIPHREHRSRFGNILD